MNTTSSSSSSSSSKCGLNLPASGPRSPLLRTRNRPPLVSSVSARTLAAALWRQTAHITSTSSFPSKPENACVWITFPIHQCPSDCVTQTKPWLLNPLSHRKSKFSFTLPTFPMEGVTKWDSEFVKSTITGVGHVISHAALFANGVLDSVSVLSVLQDEVVQSQARVQKLETERLFRQKKLKHFLKKLGEGQMSWLRREHKKVRAVFDSLKLELNRERRHFQRMEAANSTLQNDISDAKISAKLCLRDFEKERKTRKLMEQVCDELAKKVEEDQTNIDALKRRSVRIDEEERKTMQIAEVWREERLQMKLVDAKLVLEEKYQLMTSIIADVETFLRSKDVTKDRHLSGSVIDSNKVKNTSCLGTVSHDEAQSSSDFVPGSNHSVNIAGTHILTDDAKHGQIVGEESFTSEITEICLASTKQTNERPTTSHNMSRPCPNNGCVHKTVSMDRKEKLKNQSNSSPGFSSQGGMSVEDGLAGTNFAGQVSSLDLGNPHITQGIKGRIEWPRWIQRHGSKAKRIKGKKVGNPLKLGAFSQRLR